MEEPEVIYCETIDVQSDLISPDPPGPPALPPRSRDVSPFKFQENPTVVSQSYNRCCQNAFSTKQVALIMAVVFFATLSIVFIVIHFTADAKCKSSVGLDSPTNSSNKNKTTGDRECPVVKNVTSIATPTTKNGSSGLARYALKFERKNVSNYVIVETSMSAVTVCVWIKTEQSSGEPTIVSYAVDGSDNELLMYVKEKLLIVEMFAMFGGGIGNKFRSKIIIRDDAWSHICLTWESQGGSYSFYKNGNLIEKRSISSTIGKSISGGGTWVLGQDQDIVGGGFKTHDAFQGEMAELNVWNRVVSPTEILEMSKSCRQVTHEGNVKTWSDFISKDVVKGNIVKILKPTCY